MTTISVVPIDRLVLGHSSWEWPFAHERRVEIDAHFAGLKRVKPALYNGRVLMMRDFAIEGRIFHGHWFDTDFASMLAWRDWDFPDPGVRNAFGMGALRGSDGAFVLGEMSAHTANAGKIYFPAGTPEPHDVSGGIVDLPGSIAREVQEETGLTPADYTPAAGWFTVLARPRVAQMKLLQVAVPAAELCDRIRAFLAKQREPELADMHIVRGPADITGAMPPFMVAFLQHVWERA